MVSVVGGVLVGPPARGLQQFLWWALNRVLRAGRAGGAALGLL